MDAGALGGRFDDLPGAHAVDRLAPAIRAALAGEEERLVILQLVLARPEEQVTRQWCAMGSMESGNWTQAAAASVTQVALLLDLPEAQIGLSMVCGFVAATGGAR